MMKRKKKIRHEFISINSKTKRRKNKKEKKKEKQERREKKEKDVKALNNYLIQNKYLIKVSAVT